MLDIKEDPSGNGNVEGRYDANFEVFMDDSKILVSGVDPKYQFLTVGGAGGANRIITLSTTNAQLGDRFIIRNNEDGRNEFYIEIQNEGGTPLDRAYTRTIKDFIFDGTNWISAEIGTYWKDIYENIGLGHYADAHECGVAIGWNTCSYIDGVAIGYKANAYDMGQAIGYEADGHDHGVAIGHAAKGYREAVAVGFRTDTNEKLYSIALGYYSKCTRHAELAINIDGDDINRYNQMIMGGWAGETTNNTPIEIFCGGETNAKFTVRPQSALTFKIMVTARDNTSGDCASYLFDGLIKRDGANNTTMCVCNKTVLHEDDATWDCEITANDISEALKITVTGDADNTVKWAARLDGIETSFTVA